MTNFTVYFKTQLSDYMTEWVWSTIEVRIVCIVDDFKMDYETRAPNIFKVIQYRDFLRGYEEETFYLEKTPVAS